MRAVRKQEDVDRFSPRKLHLWRLATVSDPDLHAVAALLRTIPDVAAAVIRYANSAYLGRFYPVGTVLDASVRIGCRAVGALAMATAGREAMESYGTEDDWERALIVGRGAKLIAEIAGMGRERSEKLFVAGLFSGLGSAVLAARDGGYMAWRRGQRAKGLSSLEILRRERMVYGTDHAVAGAQLLEEWNLPTAIIAGVAGHHSDQPTDFEKIVTAAMAIVYGRSNPYGCLDVSFDQALAALGMGEHHDLILREASLFADSVSAAVTGRSGAEMAAMEQ